MNYLVGAVSLRNNEPSGCFEALETYFSAAMITEPNIGPASDIDIRVHFKVFQTQCRLARYVLEETK